MEECNNILPTAVELDAYREIKNEIEKGRDTSDIVRHISRLSAKFINPFVLYLYAAFRFKEIYGLVDACKILELKKDNVFVKYIYMRLISEQSGGLVKKIWSQPLLSELWANTEIAKQQIETVKIIAKKALNDSILKVNKSIVFIDLGCGAGHFALEILNEILNIFTDNRITFIGVDQESKAIQSCAELVRISTIGNVGIKTLKMSLNAKDICELLCMYKHSTVIVNAASVMHELNTTSVISVIREILHGSDFFFLTELEGNHDIENERYEELFHSAAIFYDGLTRNVYYGNMDIGDKRALIGRVFVEEFMRIIVNDYERRENYHRTHELWENVVHKSCGIINDFISSKIRPHCNRSLCYSICKHKR